MSRPRDQIFANLEALYREAFARASDAGDQREMQRLDFDFLRDQLYLEAILDVRDVIAGSVGRDTPAPAEPSITEQIGELRKLTRFPFGR